MWRLLESIKSKIWLKVAMTLYIAVVGFGYSTYCIVETINVISDPEITLWVIFIIWLVYFTLLAFPSYYSWQYIKIFIPQLSIYAKWGLMAIFILIPFIYPFTAISDLWLTRNQYKIEKKKKLKAKEKKKRMKEKELRKQEKAKKK